MILSVAPSSLRGSVEIPASKSHTIRAVVVASLADGRSVIQHPLVSTDTAAAVSACRALGAAIETGADWVITGTGGQVQTPDNVVDVGNSGTTLYITAATAALGPGHTVFTGDEQIRRRPVEPLLAALRSLGAEAFTTRSNGCAPFVVRGPLRGGRTAIECPTSQYLTGLLLNCPLAQGDTEIEVLELNERPYVRMTLDWLDQQGIRYETQDMDFFRIPGRQQYHAFTRRIPADFSSATFFLCAAAVGDAEVRLAGLDMNDSQGDKAVVGMLQELGADLTIAEDGILIRGGALRGAELDLNATPDALPAMAVAACFAEGETRLVNVPQARLKETDRLAVMRQELSKLGAEVAELPDGLVIRRSHLVGTELDGHGDHRVVMALAVAGMLASGTTTISTAEAVAVTFPDFVDLMASLGARLSLQEEAATPPSG